MAVSATEFKRLGFQCSPEPKTGSERPFHQGLGERKRTPHNPEIQHRTEIEERSFSHAASSEGVVQDGWSQEGWHFEQKCF